MTKWRIGWKPAVAALVILGLGCQQPAATPTSAPATKPPAVASSAPAASPAVAQSPAAQPSASPAGAQPSPVAKAPAGPLKTISFGTFPGANTNWPVWVGDARGFFAEEGLKLDIRGIRGITLLIQGALAGEHQIIQITPDPSMVAINGGAPLAYVGVNQKASAVQMIVNDKINSFADMKGKRIVVGEKGSTYHLLAERMLSSNGIQPGDYNEVYVPNQPDRYATFKSGQVDAAFVAQPTDFQLVREGYKSLGLASEYLKDDEFNGFVVTRDWAEKNKDTLVAFLRGVSKSNRWLVDPANRGAAVDILQKQLEVDRAVADETYELLIVKLKAFQPNLRPNKNAHQFWLDYFVGTGEINKPAPPLSKFLDDTYVEEAMKAVGL